MIFTKDSMYIYVIKLSDGVAPALEILWEGAWCNG